MSRSGHREMLMVALRPHVQQLRGTVLDVGGGRTSPLAQGWPPDVARLRLDIVHDHRPTAQCDAVRLPVRDEGIDGIVMSEVLEHVVEPRAAVEEALRVLKPNARLIGSVPFLTQGIHADPDDYQRFTEQGLRHLFRAFDDVQVVPHGGGYGVAWRMVYRGRWWLMPLNPVMRRLSRLSDPARAEGYVFAVTKGRTPRPAANQSPPRIRTRSPQSNA
jgi:SAM-dependent methyltransferase